MSETDILIWIGENLSNPVFDIVSIGIQAAFVKNIGWFLIALLLIVYKPTRRLGYTVLLAEILMTVSVECMKVVVCRDRPFLDYPFELIVDPPGGYSFPSGHTAGIAALVSVYVAEHRRCVIPALLSVVAIGFTRLYLFVHYPTDVLFGAVLGVVCAFIALCLAPRMVQYVGPERLGL